MVNKREMVFWSAVEIRQGALENLGIKHVV
jgi:hypothetical protein